MSRAAFTLYRLLARALLPAGFREEYGDQLDATVAARFAGATGMVGTSKTLLAELADLGRTALREWHSLIIGRASQRPEKHTRWEREMGGAWGDLKTSARNVARRPGLALAVTLTIGVGIGATTTVYSVVDGVILRPLPFQDSGRLVAIGTVAESDGATDPETGLQSLAPMSSDVYAILRERARSLEQVAAITANRLVVADENGLEEQILAGTVSAEVFEMLGGVPALGRTFAPEEFSISADGVAIITYEYWQSRYGGDPEILGEPLEMAATAEAPRSTIIGILAPGFRPPETFFPAGEAPVAYRPMPRSDADSHRVILNVQVLGKLATGTTLQQARLEADQISDDLEVELADTHMAPGGGARRIGVNDLRAQTVGTTASTLWIFLGAAGLLLALAAMNAASLFLARALDRRQELGVRAALGAGRARVVTLLLGEAAILSAIGGALGVALAHAGVATFLRLAPRSMPRLGDVAVDGRVLAVAAAATLGTAVVAGLLPALRLSGHETWDRLQATGRSVSEPASGLRAALVGGQLALAVVLLCGAGLLFGSFVRIRASDPGFTPDGLVVMAPAPRGPLTFTMEEISGAWRLWDPVVEALAAVPGVESVAAASLLPFQSPSWSPELLLPDDAPETVREGIAGYVVTPAYLGTMGIEVLQGRGIEPGDGPDAEPVVVVNEAFVRTQLDGRDPLGVLVRRTVETPFGGGETRSMRIVGVVENVVQSRAEEGPKPAVYLPYGQADFGQVVSWWSVIRTALPASAIVPELRLALAETDRVAQNVGPMWDRMADTRATPRFQALLISAFAIVATLLAAVGLHGSLAHSVRRRQRELGVRMALGADRASVLAMVLRQGMRVSLLGLALGMIGALALSRLLAAFLFDMQPYDPLTLVGVALVLLLVSAVACLVPARRATAVDPVRVLSAE